MEGRAGEAQAARKVYPPVPIQVVMARRVAYG